MTLCCIGGVCIPYSALLPLAVWCLQWLVEKLGLKTYIPSSWWNMLQPSKKATSKQASCCSTAASTPDPSLHDVTTTKDDSSASVAGLVRSIESTEEWTQLVSCSDQKKEVVVVAKFTATWCRPCQAIQPVFESLAAAAAENDKKEVVFCIVDVDDVEEVASDLRIGVLPTVVVMKGGTAVERYTGSHAGQLQDFVKRAIE
jgi:thioredoxin 1